MKHVKSIEKMEKKMIRPFQPEDTGRVMEIWLASNKEAHNFIPAAYWDSHYETVKQMLPEADLKVYENEEGIRGFIGLTGDYIAGIFVDAGARSEGIGKKLLEYVKQGKKRLILQVYQKNEGAFRFYGREGFSVQTEQLDEETGETEFVMIRECSECPGKQER